MTTMHFSGGVEWIDERGASTTMRPGWAACCTGDRARVIRTLKRQTKDYAAVTCKRCLRVLEWERKTVLAKRREVLAAVKERGVDGVALVVGRFSGTDPDHPPIGAAVTVSGAGPSRLVRDPRTHVEWIAAGDTAAEALRGLLSMVQKGTES